MPLDLVRVSHDHDDPLDSPTIRELARLQMPFVTSRGVGAHLEAWGVAPECITDARRVGVAYVARHRALGHGRAFAAFLGPQAERPQRHAWSSLVIRSPRHSVFFSGDTGLTNEYTTIRERFGKFDLVMLEVGAFPPSWGDIHLGPEHALEALALLGGGALLPVHWGTFSLALHDWDAPAETLFALGPKQGAQLLMPRLGVAVEPSRVEAVAPWWREVDARGRGKVKVEEPVPMTLPKEMPWPAD